ncbi:MAG: PBP1A family penicillin-binding protein [Candidatus Binatia bacterium]|nr:PBP1A family penicillin-binding protein [Candidatus Binatia bacterium]
MRRVRSLAIVLLLSLIPLGAAAGLAVLLGYQHYAEIVDEKFAGRRWDFPSRIYSDEFLLHPGLDIEASGVPRRLERLRYREVAEAPHAGGEFRRSAAALEVALRPGARGRHATERVRLVLAGGRVSEVVDLDTGEDRGAVSLEPEELTGIYQGEYQKRRAVRVVDVAPTLIRAILATEDTRYFEHHGVDVIGVGRALVANVRAGEVRQGGSTLTQQLMKNFFLTSDRTVARKLEEMAMALVAERRYSKMQILENYLNEIYLGQRGARGIFGVAEASDFYFGKDPRDLLTAEAALLAGLIRAPNAYSPFRSPERAKARRDVVLRLLLEAGDIDEETFEEAVASSLGVVAPRNESKDAAFFVDYVKRELADRFSEVVLTTEGLHIYTTLDPLLQEYATEAVRSGLDGLEADHAGLRERATEDRLEAALVAIAPRTGAVRALVGGRDYVQSQFDRVTQAHRQPGSAFKPVVYLAGVAATDPERHITAATLVDDTPFTWSYEEQEWTPRNYGDRYLGEITVRTALEKSSNAAAARVAEVVGLGAIIDLAQRMGVESKLPAVPSIVLGSAEVTPLEMVSAYGVLASGGIRAEPFTIRRVESREGQEILGEVPVFTRVVSPAEAFVVTHMMEGVLDVGTARGARKLGFGRPAAGKTGTTNEYRDAWFIGFTPDLLAGTWVGFDGDALLNLSGGRAALPIWTSFMQSATAASPERPFQAPAGVTLVEVDRRTGRPAVDDSDAMLVIEAFLAGEEPIWTDPLAVPGMVPPEHPLSLDPEPDALSPARMPVAFAVPPARR